VTELSERKATGKRDEDVVAGWLSQTVSEHLVHVGVVYLRAEEYAVEVVDEGNDSSPLVLTRVGDGRRFEVLIEVEAVELPVKAEGAAVDCDRTDVQ
jgi:hypothetical protein